MAALSIGFVMRIGPNRAADAGGSAAGQLLYEAHKHFVSRHYKVPQYLKESDMIELAPGEVLRECAARQALVLVSGKWTPLVVFILSNGTHRFSELQRRIDGISQKMLTQTLRELEGANCVRRTVIPSTPIAVEYSLTELGKSLVSPLVGIIEWSSNNAIAAGFSD